jgi:hypothetical protein
MHKRKTLTFTNRRRRRRRHILNQRVCRLSARQSSVSVPRHTLGILALALLASTAGILIESRRSGHQSAMVSLPFALLRCPLVPPFTHCAGYLSRHKDLSERFPSCAI